MKIAARTSMRHNVPPITPPMIADLEWEVGIDVEGEVEVIMTDVGRSSRVGFSCIEVSKQAARKCRRWIEEVRNIA
jgi:hypothetical protein